MLGATIGLVIGATEALVRGMAVCPMETGVAEPAEAITGTVWAAASARASAKATMRQIDKMTRLT